MEIHQKFIKKITKELIGIAYKVNDIYKMYSLIESQNAFILKKVNCNMTQKERFHKILGHVNFNYLNILCRNKLVEGMPNEFEHEYLKCGTCLQNKMHNLSFDNNRRWDK